MVGGFFEKKRKKKKTGAGDGLIRIESVSEGSKSA